MNQITEYINSALSILMLILWERHFAHYHLRQNRHLISHSWTSPGAEATCTYWMQSCTQVPATAVFTPRNCFQKVNKREKPKRFLISDNLSNTHTHTSGDGAVSLRSAHQMKRILQHAAGSQLDCLQIWEKPSLWPGHTSHSPSRKKKKQTKKKQNKQTVAWSSTHIYLISFGLAFRAY